MNQNKIPGFLTVEEAARRIGVDTSHVRRLIAAGKLQAVSLSPRVRLVVESSAESFERSPSGRKKKA